MTEEELDLKIAKDSCLLGSWHNRKVFQKRGEFVVSAYRTYFGALRYTRALGPFPRSANKNVLYRVRVKRK